MSDEEEWGIDVPDDLWDWVSREELKELVAIQNRSHITNTHLRALRVAVHAVRIRKEMARRGAVV